MEQMFQLHYHGKLSIIEQCYMSGEERRWWLKRLERQFEQEKKQSEGSSSGPSFPRPSIPSISRPSIPSMPGRK